MFWSNRVEAVTETFSPVMSKDSAERRQSTGNGCRLFGIQLLDNSNVEETSPTVRVSRKLGDIQPISSFDAESDRHSEPSNVNQSDHLPSGSCDAEKSSLRSPQESQSRQIRSCTKVVHLSFTLQVYSIPSFYCLLCSFWFPKLWVIYVRIWELSFTTQLLCLFFFFF